MLPYVEKALQKLKSKGSPNAVKQWHRDMQKSLQVQKFKFKGARQKWLASVTDPKVKSVVQGIQLPLMVDLMRQAGMKPQTIQFVRKAFTHGAEYIDEVDLTGLYSSVAKEKEYGNYEYRKSPRVEEVICC